jgi:hypothetical protein
VREKWTRQERRRNYSGGAIHRRARRISDDRATLAQADHGELLDVGSQCRAVRSLEQPNFGLLLVFRCVLLRATVRV